MVEAAPVASSVSALLLLPRRRRVVTMKRKSNLVAVNYAIYALYRMPQPHAIMHTNRIYRMKVIMPAEVNIYIS